MKSTRRLQVDRSVAALLLSNLVIICIAVLQNWDVSHVMLVYWAQSVIIGIFNWKRILDLKQFSTKGFKINGRSVEPTRKTQVQVAWFFLFHYGFFHFIYLIFLLGAGNDLGGVSVLAIAICTLTFLVNHLFSYLHNREKDRNRVPNIGSVMFFPYARIVPMHLTILLGGLLGGASTGQLVLFLGLKTVADAIMHMVEHAAAKPSDDPGRS